MKSLFRFIALAFFFLSASLVMDAKGKDEVVRRWLFAQEASEQCRGGSSCWPRLLLTPKKGCVTVKMKANSVALLQY